MRTVFFAIVVMMLLAYSAIGQSIPAAVAPVKASATDVKAAVYAPKARVLNQVERGKEGSARQRVKVRIKDVARLAGNETFTLIGYGIVTGLAGSGDSDESLIQRTISNLMQNFNVLVDEDDVKAQNTAAVMVTATINGPSHKGDMIQATVSSIGDAKSLLGGELLLTPLLGTDAETWAIAQGPVVTGGFAFGEGGAGGNTQTKNHPTTGMLTRGVKLLRDVNLGLENRDILTYYLQSPDYTAAVNLADTINGNFVGSAVVSDSATVKVRIPPKYREQGNVPAFISSVEQLYFTTDSAAKVVFNERTGTIVIGSDVRISQAAVSHGNLYVDVKKIEGISQPNAFSRTGTTERINDTTTTVQEEKVPFFEVPNTTTVGELVSVLNALGVSSRDIMVIFHVLKAAGALHAELESL